MPQGELRNKQGTYHTANDVCYDMTARENGAASDVYEMRLSRATLKLNAGEFAPASRVHLGYEP